VVANLGAPLNVPNPSIDRSVLDRDEQALRFYRSLGAELMDEWTGVQASKAGR
jgi:hypothetical protein